MALTTHIEAGCSSYASFVDTDAAYTTRTGKSRWALPRISSLTKWRYEFDIQYRYNDTVRVYIAPKIHMRIGRAV